MPDQTRALRRPLRIVAVLLAAGLALFALQYVAQALLILFAGLLIGVLVRGGAVWIASVTGLSENWSVAAFVTLLVTVLGGALVLFGAELADRADELTRQLSEAFETLRTRVEEHGLGRWLLGGQPADQVMTGGARIAEGAASMILNGLIALVVIAFLGIYVAARPEVYVAGTLRLVPRRHRARARAILEETGRTLRWWLLGQGISMASIAVTATIGFFALGVPMALPLGLFAGLLTFVPNIGPTLSAIPAVLLTLVEDPMRALYVLIFYTGLQSAESYILTPLVQRETVYLPPALTIAAQFLLWSLAGFIGLFVAAPLVVVIMVAARTLYIEEVLGEDSQPIA